MIRLDAAVNEVAAMKPMAFTATPYRALPKPARLRHHDSRPDLLAHPSELPKVRICRAE